MRNALAVRSTAEPTLQRAQPARNYQTLIGRHLATRTLRVDARHVEAWMRDTNHTLDHLSPEEFAREIDSALVMIAAAGERASEMLARTFGL